MWAEQEQYRNQFLQMQLKYLKPQKINEMVGEEMAKTQNTRSYCNKVNNPKGSCKSAFYFENRAELAYGFWRLPKLIKELNSDNNVTQWRAINSLSEYLVNPLHAQRAINLCDIVRRCQNVFLRIRLKYRNVKYRETARLLAIFYSIAVHRKGAQKILDKNRLLDQFYTIVCDREKHLEAVSKILPFLSENTENSLKLIDDYKVFDKLLNIWNRDPCISYYPDDLWLHLTHILELLPEEAVKRGFFEILYTRIQARLPQFHIWDMKCFALLLRCHEGQQRFLQVDGIKLLHTLLDEESLENYESVVFALMHGLFTKSNLWRCREFTNLPLHLIKLAKDSAKSQQQWFCLQALREMGVMPIVKRFIKENCLNDLKDLQCESLNNEKELKELIYWLQREIYHTSNLRQETSQNLTEL